MGLLELLELLQLGIKVVKVVDEPEIQLRCDIESESSEGSMRGMKEVLDAVLLLIFFGDVVLEGDAAEKPVVCITLRGDVGIPLVVLIIE